jgi:perosamine synthetase
MSQHKIKHSQPYLSVEESAALIEQYELGLHTTNELQGQVENAFLNLVGGESVRFTRTGTDALSVIVQGIVRQTGKNEFVVPNYVCQNVLLSVKNGGGIPVICDVSENWIMGINDVMKVMTKKTAAIVLVDIFGIAAFTKEFELLRDDVNLIHDCCQSFYFPEEKIDYQNDLRFFSFHSTKYINGLGGGAIAGNNDAMRYLEGLQSAYLYDINAIVLLSQLKAFKFFYERRKAIAERYFVELPQELTQTIRNVLLSGRPYSYFRFPIKLETGISRERKLYIMKKMEAEYGVCCREGVDSLLDHSGEKFPQSFQLLKETMSIPVHPSMSDPDVDQVLRAVNESFNEY